jgi:hypothetical protein
VHGGVPAVQKAIQRKLLKIRNRTERSARPGGAIFGASLTTSDVKYDARVATI